MDGLIELDGVRLATRTWDATGGAPDRPKLVFLHDSLGSVELWRDFPARLAAASGLDAFGYDRRGHGRSDPFASAPRAKTYLEKEADLLPRVLDAAGIGKAILFGHSDGGTIALLAAARHPDRIAGIVVEAGHVFIEPITLAGIRDALEAYRTTDLRARLMRWHGDKVDGLFEAWSGTWLSDAFRAWNIEACLPSILCPTLVIQGDRDEFATEAQVDSIVNRVGGPATKAWLPGIAHAPHKEVPERVLEVSTAFLRGIP